MKIPLSSESRTVFLPLLYYDVRVGSAELELTLSPEFFFPHCTLQQVPKPKTFELTLELKKAHATSIRRENRTN